MWVRVEVHCPPEAKAVAGWLCVEGEGGEGRLGKKVSTKDGAGRGRPQHKFTERRSPSFLREIHENGLGLGDVT